MRVVVVAAVAVVVVVGTVGSENQISLFMANNGGSGMFHSETLSGFDGLVLWSLRLPRNPNVAGSYPTKDR